MSVCYSCYIATDILYSYDKHMQTRKTNIHSGLVGYAPVLTNMNLSLPFFGLDYSGLELKTLPCISIVCHTLNASSD